jgi:hypothetical protein
VGIATARSLRGLAGACWMIVVVVDEVTETTTVFTVILVAVLTIVDMIVLHLRLISSVRQVVVGYVHGGDKSCRWNWFRIGSD